MVEAPSACFPAASRRTANCHELPFVRAQDRPLHHHGRHLLRQDKPRPGREQFNVGRQDYLGRLAALGVKPEEVTHVMCTHLHWDHVGWNTRLVNGQWVPTFPNAKYIMAKREYDYWDGVYQKEKDKRDNMHVLGFEDSVLPIMRAEKAVLVADDYELDKGISIEPCHGHSPGHFVINVASGGTKGVFIGDIIHHPMQLLFPDLSCRADFDMDASRKLAQGADRQARRYRHARPAPALRHALLRHHQAPGQRLRLRVHRG